MKAVDVKVSLTKKVTVAPGPWPKDGETRSVFVDASGRRSRTFRRFGWAVAVVCACYATTVAASLIGGNSSAPFLQIPGVTEGLAEAVEVKGDEPEAEQPSWEPTIPNGTLPSDWGWVEGVVPPSATAEATEAAAGEDAGGDEAAQGKIPAGDTGTVATGQRTETGSGADTAPTSPAPSTTPPAAGNGDSAGGGAGTPVEQPQEEDDAPADEPTGNGNPVDGLLGGLLGLPPLLGG